ncbi:hypothetical protein DSM106972_077300 [Dulcicalothrix desertica PCC 7102]|uniref:Uncharacterized protein n=1 Tax=Dulcicalothrix desertica PCC 7102 TaxID=232991 RepID=A0A3S1C2U8_9CYAN|nr:hypothetical protein [Dulcicalothrix desertica]RUS99288.1 hypothetical protein DSM106972_077300 [Dulcicalothrix desertica PCC 7102]TWH49954.1 hypothetical protein CAL7102_04225 [Dulcicalothrix desertica PCC 7102]
MSETATQIPLSAVIPMFTAISDRDYEQFNAMEWDFVNTHGAETWQDVFNFRVLPTLDKDAKKWLLIQKCSTGIKSVKVIAD